MIRENPPDQYISRILDCLKKMDIKKIILFGSYATSRYHKNSDIDLLVVVDENVIPQSYDEWLMIKMKVRRELREINNEVAIDLLVYTVPQYEIILQNMNSFQKKIHQQGKVLYDKAG